MNEMFFYQDSGKTVGPFSAEDIKLRIKDGKIRVFDLLYKDGDPSWRMALEHPSLSAEFKSATIASLKERPWVCLQRKGQGFVTTGPFTQDEIRASIQAGKISYSDYAWKDSLAEWKRIGSLEEFNPRARQSVLPPMPDVPKESAKELLKNVVEYQKPITASTVEDTPPEAGSDFLPPPVPYEGITKTQIPAPKVTSSTEIKKTPKREKSPDAKSEAKADDAYTIRVITNTHNAKAKSDSKREARAEAKGETSAMVRTGDVDEDAAPKRKWLDWGLVAALVLVLIGAVLIVSRFLILKPTVSLPENAGESVMADPSPAPVVTAPPPPSPQVRPEPPSKPEATAQPQQAAEPTPKPKPEPPPRPHEPTELVLSVRTPGSGQPQIEVRTDGTSGYPVHLQILGLPGQVAEGGSYYRFMRLTPNGKLRERLDVPALKLPHGKFLLRAEAGELKKETKFSWGLNDPAIKSSVNRQRKAWAFALWKERLNLFALSQALEKQVTQALVPSKKFSAKPWEKLISLKRSEGSKYLMFDEWWELRNIAKEAKTGVTAALASRAQKQREHLASFSVWK